MKLKSILTPEQELASLLIDFGKFIKSNEVRKAMRKIPTAFIRRFKFPWYDILLFLIFRRKECIPSELSSYYSSIGLSSLRISRQAAFKAIRKVNPKVFSILIDRFAERFYKSNLVKTFKGYVLLAVDGTTLNLPATDSSIERFGFIINSYIKTVDEAKKATSRSSAIYDVTNGLIVDFTMKRYIDAEIPAAVEQLYHAAHHFKNKDAIVLADRNYDSVELFSILESMDMKYCFRGKSNFFKKYLQQMTTDDEWIDVTIDKAWYRRLKYDQPKERFRDNPHMKVRVVRFEYTYFIKGKAISEYLIYFTNLSEEEFSRKEIIHLYSQRWQIESSYKTLKSDYEWERYFTLDCDSETCSIYAKVIFHNINGIIRKHLDSILEKDTSNKYQYVTNIKQLSNLIRDEAINRWIRNSNQLKLLHIMELILELKHKIKVPVRPNRHHKRWGRHISSSNPTRFRIDGRNWPNTIFVNGHLQTSKPY